MTQIKERFSTASAIAWYLREDRAEVEHDRRYQPTRTPCAVYLNGDEYLAATSSARKPRESDYIPFGYWAWEEVATHPYGWTIWRARREPI